MPSVSYAAVCFPEMAEYQRAWIDSVREKYDPKAKLIDAHVTVVFPQTAMTETAFESRIEQIANRTAEIPIRFTKTEAVMDIRSGCSYLYLVAEGDGMGRGAVIALHDSIYDNALADTLRNEVRYEPHITLGVFESVEQAGVVADELNEKMIEIVTCLNGLHLVQVDGNNIQTGAFFSFSKACH